MNAELYRAAEECAAVLELPDVEHLIQFLLQRVLVPEQRALDAAELEMVEARLRDLGYLE